jgi:murein DD-endopeptidase MepM/ murein hydrolase activator NlpD
MRDMVREDSNQGGCSAFYSASSNYVLIDHGDGTAGLYMHLAYDSAQVAVGQEVRQGEPIAISGETGVTCSGDTGLDPGAHLHFQVQPFVEGKYFTQSQPIAFDDYRRGDYPAALAQMRKAGDLGFFAGPMIVAISHAQLGHGKEAHQELERAIALDPTFAKDPRAALRLHHVPESLIEQFMVGLRKAGLRDSIA